MSSELTVMLQWGNLFVIEKHFTNINITPLCTTACALNSSKHTVFVWTMMQNTIQRSGRVPSNDADFAAVATAHWRHQPLHAYQGCGTFDNRPHLFQRLSLKPFPSCLHVNVLLTMNHTSLKTTTKKRLCFNVKVSCCSPKLSPGIICHVSTLNSGSFFLMKGMWGRGGGAV